MQIQPIGFSAPTQNNNSNTSFNGRIIIKGSNLDNSLVENIQSLKSDTINALLEGHDLVLREYTKKVRTNNSMHFKGTRLFKIVISRVKENSTLAKIADMLHLIPRHGLTTNYHSHTSFGYHFDKYHIQELGKHYNIE